jgi:hypothetical protein
MHVQPDGIGFAEAVEGKAKISMPKRVKEVTKGLSRRVFIGAFVPSQSRNARYFQGLVGFVRFYSREMRPSLVSSGSTCLDI